MRTAGFPVMRFATVAIVLGVGCQAEKKLPPLFSEAPQIAALPDLQLQRVPAPPPAESVPISFKVPGQKKSVPEGGAIMRKGTVIRPGSSVVISVPASIYQRSQEASAYGIANELGFRTDGYFNVLEQYIERAMIAVGFQVKDRAKFEAKLRDVRDSGLSVRQSDEGYAIGLASLAKDLEAGAITQTQFAEKTKALREKLLEPLAGARNREEMTDISEVIRAAQDGEVMADYVLQVNDLSVLHFSGTPLQLSDEPAVRSALKSNPGLRIADGQNDGGALPATLNRPWAQARFNAKLIDVKTGSIDWIGEYDIESLAVLEDGIDITIGVRRRTSNGTAIVNALQYHNELLSKAYQRALGTKGGLEKVYGDAMQPVRYKGTKVQGEAIQGERRAAVQMAEKQYSECLAEYRALTTSPPREARLEWTYAYDVDAPSVKPDLLRPKTEEESRKLLEHVKALGFKVTNDLLETVKMSG